MSEINKYVGQQIRNYRKLRKKTIEDLAADICKSKSTVSKYEKGEITVDVETLYDIADALHVHVEQFLYCRPDRAEIVSRGNNPAFFNGLSQFHSYLYDGRINRLIRCIFDVLSVTEENKYKIMMYMNYDDPVNYQNCETTYWGYIEHYDALTYISLFNRDTPMEQASVQILASYLDSDTKWGLFNGFSSRPIMPIATKMLFSKVPLKEDAALISQLKISKNDIRLMKMYNMLSVT
ncbi:MAG: helix-turn-helix transcriptional regulator [Bacillota bacterium]|nr:helix-turn-helix transcriptional regulator [Bacillota bacterium]